ncbi:protein kinase [Streptomyces sp. NPDC127197]|uniref:protein kinase domain-containing protein n=1 Tax=Streptomyces sp. NPDC127197 TaxID=3345388 RepID=UPI003632B70E
MRGTRSDALVPGDPERLGRYELIGRLGSGGMGQVYLGRSPGGRLVAVKTVHEHLAADPHYRERFRREAAAARSVTGVYTAPVVDADPDSPMPWLATAYLPGVTLRQAVVAAGPLAPGAVRALGGALAEALRSIHAAGLVHRDLKPSNLLVTGDGPRVIDFGIARLVSAHALTETGDIIGTPGYMAPEQITGDMQVTAAADVFALGAVLAYAASGRGPFGGGGAAALLYRVVHDEPDLVDVPEAGGLRELVAECLHKSPERRPGPAEVLRRTADRNPPLWWRAEPLRSLVSGVADAVPEPGPTVVVPTVVDEAARDAARRAIRRRELTRRGLLLGGGGGLVALLACAVGRTSGPTGEGSTGPIWELKKGATRPGALRWTLSAGSGTLDAMLVTAGGIVLHGTEDSVSTDGTVQFRTTAGGTRRWAVDSFTEAPKAWGVVDGVLTAGDLGLEALDLTTGKRRTPVEKGLLTPLWFTVSGSTLVTLSRNGSGENLLRGASLKTGQRLWQRKGEDEWPRPAVAGDALLFTDGYDEQECVFADDGTVRWRYSGVGKGYQVAVAGALPPDRFAVLTTGRVLHLVDVRDGRRISGRELDVPVAPGATAFARADNTGLLLSGERLYGLDPDAGTVRWSRPALGLDACWAPHPGGDRSPVLAGGQLLHWAADGRTLEALDPATGRPRWRRPELGDGPAQCPPAVSGGTVYAAAGRKCTALRLSDGVPLRDEWSLDGVITGLAADASGWYARIGRGSVVAVNGIAAASRDR